MEEIILDNKLNVINNDIKEVKADWQIFQTTYSLWKAINDEIKPRNLSYQLKHKK